MMRPPRRPRPPAALRRALTTGLAVACLLPWAAPDSTAAGRGVTTAATAAAASELDQVIPQAMRRYRIPGAVVGFWMPGRGYVHAFGVADKTTREPISIGDYSRIGSETKTFTATALLELVDEGRVRLDDPVSKYLTGVPDGDEITLRDLLDMRSGLHDYVADPRALQAFFSDPCRHLPPSRLLAYAFADGLDFSPGTRFEYTDTNYIVLGLIIERVTGRHVGDVIREKVTGPGGLHGSFLAHGPHPFPSPHARGYTVLPTTGAEADATFWNPSWAWAAGAMVSDLHDQRRWAREVALGTLLDPATQRQRLDFRPTGIPGVGYGLGLFEVHGWIGHNGRVPGYEDLAVYLPRLRATLVIMTDTDVQYQGTTDPLNGLAKAITGVVTPGNVFDIE